ncbi:MAG: hypothetical protein U0163_04965 [Gemmatimonadaceae bacterium]
MSLSVRRALSALILLPTVSLAQHGGGGGGRVQAAPPPQASQFDFLVGQWELTVHPKVSSLAAKIHGAPKLLGTWKAWKAFDGWGIEDELRILDGSGNPQALSQALRVFDPASGQWSQTLLDVYRTRFGASTGQWKDGEMHISGSSTATDGTTTVSRTRFFAITANSFKYATDRSTDNGKTWDEGVLTIEAKRVAATAPR